MKKSIYILILLFSAGMFACNQKHEGPSQEDFDKLSKKLVENETRIAQLEDEIEIVKSEVSVVAETHDSLLTNTSSTSTSTASGDTKPKMQWVDWEQLSGGSTKTYKGVPYTGGFTQYFPNRTKQLTGYYTNGYRSGKWTYYNKNGTVKDVKYY